MTGLPGRAPSSFTRAARTAAEWLAEGNVGVFPAALVAVALFAPFQAIVVSGLTWWAGTGVGIDDAEQLTYMPYLWWGYGGSQPPLYTWLSWLVSQVFGTSVLTLKIVKYALLALAAWSIMTAMRRFGYARTTAVAAMFGLFTMPQIIWESQRALTHSVAVVGFCALMMLAFINLLERRSTLSYVLFGLAVAAAILAKYNDLILVLAIVGAALSLPGYRGVILDRKMLLAVAVALLALAPTLAWTWANQDALLARTDSFEIEPGKGSLLATAMALSEFVEAIFNLTVLPVIVCIVAFFLAGLVVRDLRAPVPQREELFWRMLAVGLAIVGVAVLMAGAGEVKARWLLPVMIPLPLALAALMERLYPKGRDAQLTVIAAGAAIALLSAPGIWYFQARGGSGLASIIRLDYPSLYATLTADGPVATVVSDKPWIGNLRRVDEKLVTLHQEFPDFAGVLEGPAVLVWMGNGKSLGSDSKVPAKVLRSIEHAGFELAGDVRRLDVPELSGGAGATREIAVVRLRQSATVPAARTLP